MALIPLAQLDPYAITAQIGMGGIGESIAGSSRGSGTPRRLVPTE
jgi:hypothetical protein